MANETRKRIAVIDYDLCSPKKCGGWYCEQVCPVNRAGKDCITHQAEEKPNISEELCIGCLICEKKCPFNAISVVNLSLELEAPIHQFGKNMFRLHRLPLPKEGSVIGIVGRNGIGKTTAIRILSGELIPNFGNLEEKPSWEKLIEAFRGKEIQAFFKRLGKKEITIAIKPQAIEKIPKAAKGKVLELLKKIAAEEQVLEVSKKLNIEGILGRQLEQVSGGELQKIAIAATGLKKADFYFFDEPSSYLDIRERLRVAEFIRNIAAQGKAVLVVEHDLVLLDYLSDFIHLMYGKPGVFGVISQVKTTREGINIFLDGYSKDENYRFRSYAIEFAARAARETKKGRQIASWPAMSKKLGSFSLEAEANSINQGEVIGILGPNGIGKTTFVKMIAGVLKPDSKGQIDMKLKVAFKPQYLEIKTKKTSGELFRDEGISTEDADTKNSILRPLDLEQLFEKKVSELSGGELQRLAIGLTLARKSDLILLDEPSANLDVEQRLNVAKTIRSIVESRGTSALIVDHDLLFMDYIADRLMVFEGEPAKHGIAKGPFEMEKGMNLLLGDLGITLRRDKNTKRPRVNKPGSVIDREQKQSGKYYYE